MTDPEDPREPDTLPTPDPEPPVTDDPDAGEPPSHSHPGKRSATVPPSDRTIVNLAREQRSIT